MLTIYTLDQSAKWDSIVSSFSDHDVYYLSTYVTAFKIHGDGEPLLFYYEGKNTRAINVVMKRDISLDKHFEGKLEKGKYTTTPVKTELSENIKLQVESIGQANDGINRISEVVQNNSATAEESSATSEELSANAMSITELVSKFQLRG